MHPEPLRTEGAHLSDSIPASEIIELLDLAPLPEEGGMFRQVWQTADGSAIYFLVRPDDFSALHRLDRPEVWHHYLGAPLQLVLLHPDGQILRPVLGDDLRAGHRPLVVVQPGVWMGAYPLGDWSLTGTTMAPPFNPDGFELGERGDLLATYPGAETDIVRLTRMEGT